MLLNLSGRLSVVTGAASGIGKATALRLASAGSTVALLDNDIVKAKTIADELNTKNDRVSAVAIQVDVTSAHEINEALKLAKEKLDGRFTFAANCAGITADGFLLNQTEAQWDRVLDVNLKGTFLFTQAVAKVMIEEGDANAECSIVNISSIVGKSGNLGQVNYAASKAGVVAFTKTAAQELARNKIRVNCILPGFIHTPMSDAVPEKVKTQFVKQIPLQRFGQPNDIADACVFLASDNSSYITGASIEITGGYNM